MKLIILTSLFFISLSSLATQLQCDSLFVKVPLKNSNASEAPALWFEALNKNDPSAVSTLEEMTLVGKKVMRQGSLSAEHQDFFRFIIELNKSQLTQLEPKHLLGLFKLFSYWNIYPPKEFQTQFWQAMTAHLPLWTFTNYENFALMRKLNPMVPSSEFLIAWKTLLLKNFPQMSATRQLEVLGAELLHQTYFSMAELRYLIDTTTQSVLLKKAQLPIKSLKEMFRALLLLRAFETGVFFVEVHRLEQALENQLNSQGLSLDQAGRSGDLNNQQSAASSPLLKYIEQQMNISFGFSPKEYEFSSAAQFGFFDPVDIYYSDLRLIVEWDGPHHYFKKIDHNANWIKGHEQLVLRPMDRARDAILKRHGYSIFRISSELNNQIGTTDIVDLIKEQNPEFEIPDQINIYNVPQD